MLTGVPSGVLPKDASVMVPFDSGTEAQPVNNVRLAPMTRQVAAAGITCFTVFMFIADEGTMRHDDMRLNSAACGHFMPHDNTILSANVYKFHEQKQFDRSPYLDLVLHL